MRLFISAALSVTLALFSVGCGNTGVGFGQDGGDGDGGSSDGDNGMDNTIGFGDTGTTEGGGCVNLQCQQTCPSTTISGTVYDPAAINGLYNVFVYVPNNPLQPIADGPVCTQCQAPASGNPVASATSDAKGHFSIPNAPVGANIPLVLQLGKWRRHLTISNVACGVDNAQPDKSLRFPIKQHETSPDDNIPLMAMTTGCDGAECFFVRRLGIDQAEFTGSTGTGRVRIYPSVNASGATFPGVGSGSLTAQQLWATKTEMMKFDIIFDACECSTYDRGGAGGTNIGYKNYLDYLNAGGRAFATHYYYNFFASLAECGGYDTTCQGQSPLPTTGAWEGNTGKAHSTTGCPSTSYPTCLNIDTAIPKGVAFADWYANNNPKIKPTWGGEKYGYVGLTDIRADMGALSASLLSAGTATPWLFSPDLAEPISTMPTTGYDAYYFSINTPVGTDPKTQCGRAVFSDVHLNAGGYGTFPTYCAPTNTDSHAPNDLALEFLFFDLSSCVQDDTMPPPPPPH
jgi:hypothetical protein